MAYHGHGFSLSPRYHSVQDKDASPKILHSGSGPGLLENVLLEVLERAGCSLSHESLHANTAIELHF